MNRRDGYCPSCGNALNPSSPFCPTCGKEILHEHRSGKLIPNTVRRSRQLIPNTMLIKIGPPNLPALRERPRTVLIALAVIVLVAATISLPFIIGALTPHPPTPQSQTAPTPTPIPTVKVTIKLVDVFCKTKESTLGWHDQFYTLTTFAAPDKNPTAQADTRALLSRTTDIIGGQDLPLSLTVFEGEVPLQGNVRGGFTAYNDEQGLGWANIDSWNTDINQAVANDLSGQGTKSNNLDTVTSGDILSMAVNAWYQTAHLSNDNAHQLGSMELTVPASGSASDTAVWHFQHSNGPLDNWDYTLKYQITRAPLQK